MTAATLTLSDFLLARIAEDERDLPSKGGVDWLHRVLAECEAKRQIVEAYAGMEALPSEEQREQRATLRWACQLLAAPYADHPDYREEWRP